MVKISNAEYAALVEQRDSMARALATLADLVEANQRSGESESIPVVTKDQFVSAVHEARDVLAPWFADTDARAADAEFAANPPCGV